MEPHKQPSLDIQTRLIGRAARDANFRQQLLANGRDTIEKELGIKLPPDIEIQVIEETPSRLCLVLPMKQEAQGKVSDADLAGIAGGIDTVPLPDKPVANIPGPMPVYSIERLLIYTRR